MACRLLKLRMEERHPTRSLAANILNKQSWVANKEQYSNLGVERDANNSSPLKKELCCETVKE
jgi:hypothetical protein